MLAQMLFQKNYVDLPKLVIPLITYQKQYSTQPVSMAFNEYATTDADSGSPPVVIMHGLLGSKTNWRGISKGLLTKFKPNRKIYTLDARNHGESPHTQIHNYEAISLDIAHFFQEQSIEKAVIMGHSMGGRAMMYFALKYPNLVDRAIILDISPIDMPRDFLHIKNLFQAMDSAKVPKGTPLPKARQMVEEHLRKTISDQSSFDFFLQNLKKLEDGTITWAPNLKALMHNLQSIGSFPQDIMKSNQYRGPTLFIGGTQSNFINPHDWPKIQKIFPNSELLWLKSGHLVHYEQPQLFMEHVSTFLNKSS